MECLLQGLLRRLFGVLDALRYRAFERVDVDARGNSALHRRPELANSRRHLLNRLANLLCRGSKAGRHPPKCTRRAPSHNVGLLAHFFAANLIGASSSRRRHLLFPREEKIGRRMVDRFQDVANGHHLVSAVAHDLSELLNAPIEIRLRDVLHVGQAAQCAAPQHAIKQQASCFARRLPARLVHGDRFNLIVANVWADNTSAAPLTHPGQLGKVSCRRAKCRRESDWSRASCYSRGRATDSLAKCRAASPCHAAKNLGDNRGLDGLDVAHRRRGIFGKRPKAPKPPRVTDSHPRSIRVALRSVDDLAL